MAQHSYLVSWKSCHSFESYYGDAHTSWWSHKLVYFSKVRKVSYNMLLAYAFHQLKPSAMLISVIMGFQWALDQCYSTWGTRRHLKGYVQFKIYILNIYIILYFSILLHYYNLKIKTTQPEQPHTWPGAHRWEPATLNNIIHRRHTITTMTPDFYVLWGFNILT
jgi:hypothetical protein